MPQEKITIKFEPKGHKALEHAIKQLHASQVLLEKGVNAYKKRLKELDLQQKKVNNNTVLGTRSNRLLANSFATLRSKLLLVSFAMSMGIRQLISFTKEAAKVESMGRAFNTLSGGTVKSSIAMEKLKVATGGTMSQFDLFQQANNAMVLGITKNSDEMAEMFDIAQRLGRALGQDTAMSVESLITGIGRQSRLMLDNIGIIVKAEEAYEAYAKKLNKTADSLTDVEKKQAFLEATMTSAREKVATLGDETITAQDSFDRFKSTVDDLTIATGNKLKGALSGAMNAFSDFVDVQQDADVETAMASKSIEIMAITIKRLEDRIRDVHSAHNSFIIGLNAGVRTGELQGDSIELLNEQIRALKNNLKEARLAQNKFGETVEDVAFQTINLGETLVKNLVPQLTFVNELYAKSKEAQLELVDARIAELESFIAINGATNDEAIVLEELIELKKKLTKADKESIETNKLVEIGLKAIADEMARLVIETGSLKGLKPGKILGQMLLSNLLQKAAGALIGGIFGGPAGAVTGAAAAHEGGLIKNNGKVQRFATGGSIRGGDNVPILAQGGEFVMQRSAVDSLGIENLNRMNQGGGSSSSVTVNVSGNVMSKDFVEGELAENIKEAIRRGADFGIG